MFSYSKIKGRDNLPAKYNKKKYPQFEAADLPRNYFCFLVCGVRGSGKTEAAIKLLKLNEQSTLRNADGDICGQRCIVFCPTIEGNQIYTSLKYLDENDIYTSYSDQMLEDVLAGIKHEKEESDRYQELKKLVKKFNTIKNVDRLSAEEWFELERINFELPEPPRFPNGCITNLIFDDLVGTDCFKAVGKSRLTNTVLNGRHLGVNIFILSQNLKAVPKSIRANSTILAVFKYGQRKVLEDIYDECSDLMDFDSFEKLYYEITDEPHNFMLVDHTQPRASRIKRNFEFVVNVSSTKKKEKPVIIEDQAEKKEK